MTESGEFLKKYVNQDLIRIIISGPRKKEGPSKIQIRPLLIKGQLKYQITQTVGQKELHQNYEEAEVCRMAEEWIHTEFRLSADLRMIHVDSDNENYWVFFRMRKRHLLPALHDGMQGDEDGMQTCERPPLWAFGWPRGGVHMFTSLHVACLARVA